MRYLFYLAIMRKHNGMRPQDVAILLKMVSGGNNTAWKVTELADSLHLSQSEISESLHRSHLAGLLDAKKKLVLRQGLMEFLEHGIQYVFPQQAGTLVRGMPTAHSHPFMQLHITGTEHFVWPSPGGSVRGQLVEPLFKHAVTAAGQDVNFYKLLALTDVMRVGKNREKKIATAELKKILLHES
jgi:hypothetical protein